MVEVTEVAAEPASLFILIREMLGGVSITLSGTLEAREILLIVRHDWERSTSVLMEAQRQLHLDDVVLFALLLLDCDLLHQTLGAEASIEG